EVSTQLNHPEKISITLADERYGKVDHEDSNWHQLIQAGFDFHPFASIPVLVGRSVAETVKHFSLILQKNDRTVIALLGMGPDGHTSGILPNSLAAYERDAPVMAYQGPDHMRITTTPAYLGTIDIAILYVTGRNKHEPLSRFITTDQDPIVYPVQYLKTIPDLRVITDMEKPNE
ncbi:MAG TPA: 6-phosphogluconolactonase, partial [Candidatus Nitrosotenuis sp.]|nr:6-phosphogluconolactonase [Candidatus Nitrosotenuis sp.]